MSEYSEELLDLIFAKAKSIPGSPNRAIDCDGRIIERSQYGKRGEYGWDVDHITPLALRGADTLDNLRPRHWRGNQHAGGLLGVYLRNLGGDQG